MEISNNISFGAIPGAEVLRRVSKECSGDEARVNKFITIFNKTFIDDLDKNTVVDVTRRERFIFSHKKFPDILYQSKQKLDKGRGNNFQEAMIMACPVTFKKLEHKMVRKIIAESINSGVDFQKLEQSVEANIENSNTKNYFLNNIKIAQRIKENNPKSKLTFDEFDEMEMIIFNELSETPGTPEYNMLHGNMKLAWQ